MKLNMLKYGYYQHYCSGDGSMYDHCTAYTRAQKHNTVFSEDDEYYYDILDNGKPYKKDAEYGETLVTIQGELSDILPVCLDAEKEYTIDEIFALLPKGLMEKNLKKNSKKNKRFYNVIELLLCVYVEIQNV